MQIVIKECKTCHKSFEIRKCLVNAGRGIYCSLKCYWVSITGNKRQPHSAGTKDKLREQKLRNKNPRWKGGKCGDCYGYVLIKKPNHPLSNSNGYVREHRLVVESQIGRYLTSKEAVHHRGEKDDNQPHMLMAFTSNAVHRRFEGGKKIDQSEIIYDGRKRKER